MTKYRNKKTTVDGIRFDSMAEAKRHADLLWLVKAGRISELQCQVVYVLAPSVVLDARKKPALRYVADFRYVDQQGQSVIEDVKGVITPLFRVKQHLMKSVHGLDVKVIA